MADSSVHTLSHSVFTAVTWVLLESGSISGERPDPFPSSRKLEKHHRVRYRLALPPTGDRKSTHALHTVHCKKHI